jgi:broad specificity phosphatase PhoE
VQTFKGMKDKIIANVENIEFSERPSEESFGLTEDMSNEEKCKALRKEYTKWNGQTAHKDPKKKKRAKEMVKIIADLRKQYNC